MNFDEWRASARRVHMDDSVHAQAVIDAFEGEVPGEEILVFGEEGSWLAISADEGGETYHVVTPRWSGESDDLDTACQHLWEERAKFEQDTTPELGL